ncbi:MAG: lamin tail domain-containing protein, partial [Flavobacteriales bacterium]|nr:lamin tail domain-containing protein [Flavobacteriales bacterium]
MRCLILFFSVACCAFAGWGQGVLINELQPACQRSLSTPEGDHPDWVELIGTGPRTVDLNGHTLSLGARHHRFTSTLTLAPKQHLLLFFDGHPERGVTHVDLKLAREGGTLLLIAPDGGTVIDLYSWPSLPVDVSIGRLPDGARSWSFFPTP